MIFPASSESGSGLNDDFNHLSAPIPWDTSSKIISTQDKDKLIEQGINKGKRLLKLRCFP